MRIRGYDGGGGPTFRTLVPRGGEGSGLTVSAERSSHFALLTPWAGFVERPVSVFKAAARGRVERVCVGRDDG